MAAAPMKLKLSSFDSLTVANTRGLTYSVSRCEKLVTPARIVKYQGDKDASPALSSPGSKTTGTAHRTIAVKSRFIVSSFRNDAAFCGTVRRALFQHLSHCRICSVPKGMEIGDRWKNLAT